MAAIQTLQVTVTYLLQRPGKVLWHVKMTAAPVIPISGSYNAVCPDWILQVAECCADWFSGFIVLCRRG